MFAAGGIAYVYLCYGIHHLFNVVTGKAGTPHAVLIRAGQPLFGVATMLRRRDKQEVGKSLMAGPGSLARALGITTADTGADLHGGRIWIEDHELDVDECSVTVGPRIGVDYAGDDASRPYRFRTSAGLPETLNQCSSSRSNPG